MTEEIPASGTLDSYRRDLKHRMAAAEVVGDDKAVKQAQAALDENAAAKDKLLRDEAEAAAAARKAAAEAAEAAGEVDAAAKAAPKGRTAAPPKVTAAGAEAQGK